MVEPQQQLPNTRQQRQVMLQWEAEELLLVGLPAHIAVQGALIMP
jgi:hypothetical protein